LALRAVFGLDDFVTGDDSSNQRFRGKRPALETGSAHINDRPSKRRAAASPQPFLLGMLAAGKRFPDAAKHSMVPAAPVMAN